MLVLLCGLKDEISIIHNNVKFDCVYESLTIYSTHQHIHTILGDDGNFKAVAFL